MMRLFTKQQIVSLLKENLEKFYVYGLYRTDIRKVFYIGKGKKKRLFDHLRGKSSNPHKDSIIKKVGEENILFLIIFVDSEKEAFELEIKRISEYRKNLCNMTEGGEGTVGRRHSEEIKRKISKSHIGIVHTKEVLEKLKMSLKGRITTKETRDKLRIASTGRVLSEETKRKMSESRKRYNATSKGIENIKKLSVLGKNISEEMRMNRKIALKKFYTTSKGIEQRRKISEIQKCIQMKKN